MIAILDFVPVCCPNCGAAIRIIGAMASRFFHGGVRCAGCDCHLAYNGADKEDGCGSLRIRN